MNQSILAHETLDAIRRETFDYFVHEVNPVNGLIVDRNREGSPATLTAYLIGARSRGFACRLPHDANPFV